MWHRKLDRESRMYVLLQLLGNQPVGYRNSWLNHKPTLLVGNVHDQFVTYSEEKTCSQQFEMDEPLPGRFLEPVGRNGDMRRFDTLTREAKQKLAQEILSDMLNLPHLGKFERNALKDALNRLLG